MCAAVNECECECECEDKHARFVDWLGGLLVGRSTSRPVAS